MFVGVTSLLYSPVIKRNLKPRILKTLKGRGEVKHALCFTEGYS